MFLRLFLLFTIVPTLELLLLLWITQHTSFVFAVSLVLVTGVVGASLARWQGWRTMGRIQQELAEGRMPTDSLMDGMMILVAGALLITPGVMTDAFGFMLLVPPARRVVKRWLARRLRARFTMHEVHTGPWGAAASPREENDRIIDVRLVDPPKVEDD